MPFYGDIFRANFFDLKNSKNRQNNGDLEPRKDFGTNFLTFFKFLAGVSKTIAAVAVATAFRVLY